MTDEIGIKSENEDGDNVAKDESNDTETKQTKEAKPRSVSFNRDVHVKRFGKPHGLRDTSSEYQSPTVRKEPFTHLTEQELIDEANKVIAQAESVTCTADHPPEKFYSLPNRKKLKDDRSNKKISDDSGTPENKGKFSLERSISDVTSKKRKERTSLSTLFRRAQRNKSPDTSPIVIATKPRPAIKRSKSDVSDLKSTINKHPRPIRKRSGSESEEFLKPLRNKKAQLSPIIESSPREDYFQKKSPLEVLENQKLTNNLYKVSEENSINNINKVNPVEKPPRYRTPEKIEPKAPVRIKKSKAFENNKEQSPPIIETPKRRTDIKKTVLVDEINSANTKDYSFEIKDRIKDSIRKIEENIYGSKEMIHSSQQPPDKLPLTKGNTVDHIVKILKEDQFSPPPNLISSQNSTNINQPFSYTKASISPDTKLFKRNTSPDRVPSPVNKMNDKGVVYAQVIRDRGENGNNKFKNMQRSYPSPKDRYINYSDEDEGLGYEERYKYPAMTKYDYDYKNENNGYSDANGYKIIDSPIRPKFREYKLTNLSDFNEPTYANEYPIKVENDDDYIDKFRGRADGMDTKRKLYEPENQKVDLDFNELSHRRQLLESRLNARRIERERNVGEPISRYLAETDPIYEAQKRMRATEKYVNETAKYYRHTLKRDGFAENISTEDYNKYDSDNHRIKYNTETRTFQKLPTNVVDKINFMDKLETKPRFKEVSKDFPPEPEYEPPSLEFNSGKPMLSPDEYKEKKYKVNKQFISNHEVFHTGQRYKVKDDWFGKRKGHYSSNPELAHEREDDYMNIRSLAKQPESYHNSLRRSKSKDRYNKGEYSVRRHDSGDSRDYYRDNQSPRRYDIDNRLVDSGIENDFRKDSSVEIHRTKHRRNDSYDDARDTSLFLDSERKHTEDNYPSEQIYANGEYLARFEDFRSESQRKEYTSKERSNKDGKYIQKNERYDKSSSNPDDKIDTKPPKAKKLSGLERVKQLFSRDSSKKSKKEKDVVQPKTRTRVLKSPEYLAKDDSDYRRYTDPEPSDIDVNKKVYEYKDNDRKYRSSREDLDKYRHSDSRDSEQDRKYRNESDARYERNVREVRRHKERRYHSSDRDSDHHSRPSDAESDLKKSKSRSRTAGPIDSPTLAERYRERRRLATPSPTPSPPLRPSAPPPNTSTRWFKSMERLGRNREKTNKFQVEKESIITTEDESNRKTWSKTTKPDNTPPKNLRFFGDTDPDSDSNSPKHTIKSKGNSYKSHNTLRKTLSNSSTGIDEVDHAELKSKSYSLSNLHREEKSEFPRNKQYHKRNLHNISENQTNSEIDSHLSRKSNLKPPISPYDRRSRSQSSSKNVKDTKNDTRKPVRNEDRGSSSDLRSSKQDLKGQRRTPALSGESSTEGESSRHSHHSQRSVVYLHATTVGDIPDPGRLAHNRSRDDVSSVNSSNLQIRSTTKSFSLFAPWTPRHYSEQQDVHYAQRPRKPKPKEGTFRKTSSTKNLAEERPATLQKNKSYSQTTLTRRPQSSRLSSSSTTLHKKTDKRHDDASIQQNTTLSRKTSRDAKKSQSNELLNRNSDNERLSRSISMPKDNNKKAGWFKLTNKNKKQEINTRVR